jgi:hypothetical protein
MSNKTQHTPEPWVGNSDYIIGLNQRIVCTLSEYEEANANAKRIVECVNAMQGIADPKNFVNDYLNNVHVQQRDRAMTTLTICRDQADRLKADYNKTYAQFIDTSRRAADLSLLNRDLLEALKEARQEWAHWMMTSGNKPTDDPAFVRCAKLIDRLTNNDQKA